MNTCVSVFHKITDTSSVTAGRVMSPAPIATGAPRSQKGDVAEKMILKNSGENYSTKSTTRSTTKSSTGGQVDAESCPVETSKDGSKLLDFWLLRLRRVFTLPLPSKLIRLTFVVSTLPSSRTSRQRHHPIGQILSGI
jgi:hypothetical protein